MPACISKVFCYNYKIRRWARSLQNIKLCHVIVRRYEEATGGPYFIRMIGPVFVPWGLYFNSLTQENVKLNITKDDHDTFAWYILCLPQLFKSEHATCKYGRIRGPQIYTQMGLWKYFILFLCGSPSQSSYGTPFMSITEKNTALWPGSTVNVTFIICVSK